MQQVCPALLLVVGTAQLPGSPPRNPSGPHPGGRPDPEVRESVPRHEVAGRAAIPALLTVVAACGR